MIKEKIDKIIDEYKTVKREKVDTDSIFLKLENYNCYLNNGVKVYRERIVKGDNNGCAAIILPVTKENKIIICAEPRVFVDSTVSVDLPAGYINKGEKGMDAAKRELLEETGYTSDEFKLLGKFFQDHGVSSACNEFYLATDCYKVSSQKLDDDEIVTQLEITIDELFYLLDNGYIKGLNSAYIIEKCRPYLERIK